MLKELNSEQLLCEFAHLKEHETMHGRDMQCCQGNLSLRWNKTKFEIKT